MRCCGGKHMGLEGIKLIACDLDGALLHPGECEPRSEAFELIDELHRRGIVFMPASGRQYASLRYLFAPVADELAYVCENGALVMSEGRAVVKRSMERNLAMDIANAVVAYPHADVTLSCEGHLYTISGNDAFVDHLRYEVHCDVAVVDRPEDIDDEPEFMAKHTDCQLDAQVDVSEMMGAEIYLYLEYKGNKMTARVAPTSKARNGDTVRVAFDPHKVHLFDVETEQTILN